MLAALLVLASLSAAPSDASALDTAFAAYWSADTLEARDAAARTILATGTSFADLHARLRAGRTYADDVKRDKFFVEHEINGLPHYALIMIPVSYDAGKPIGLRMELHGGMGQPQWKANDGSWQAGWAKVNNYNNRNITILPAGWWDSMWWEHSQYEHLHTLLAEVKRDYNVDENRVVLTGGSDGCVALFFYAMRDAMTWAAYIGVVGFPARLTNPSMRPDGQLHLSNMRDTVFLLWNAGRDHIVNIEVVRKYLDVLRTTGASIDAREHLKDGHGLELTQQENDDHSALQNDARRDPLPDSVSWSTERVDRYNRHSWLVIDELIADHPVDDANILPRITGRNVPRVPPPDPQPWGRVELERSGNSVRATSEGVRRFTLLLSPDEFDFDQPLRVELDGELVFEGALELDPALLLHHAARDEDRSMLFGAELEIVVAS